MVDSAASVTSDPVNNTQADNSVTPEPITDKPADNKDAATAVPGNDLLRMTDKEILDEASFEKYLNESPVNAYNSADDADMSEAMESPPPVEKNTPTESTSERYISGALVSKDSSSTPKKSKPDSKK